MRPLFCIFMHPHQLMDAKKTKQSQASLGQTAHRHTIVSPKRHPNRLIIAAHADWEISPPNQLSCFPPPVDHETSTIGHDTEVYSEFSLFS